MYTSQEQEIIDHAKEKVGKLFEDYPVLSHGFKHADAVAVWSKKIAVKEKARSIFLCELSGYVHDIGRAAEFYDIGLAKKQAKSTHHELSYQVLQTWFQSDKILQKIPKKQQKELLYAVRYHWNDQANHFDTAWILRDADKLDLFGKQGLQRHQEYYAYDIDGLNRSLRFAFASYYWVATKTARQIIKKQKLMEPIEIFYKKFLNKQIKSS